MTVGKLKIVAVVVLLVGLGAGSFAWVTWTRLGDFGLIPHRSAEKTNVDFKVSRGDGPRVISKRLQDRGLVDDSEQFYRYLRFVAKKTGSLKAGDYVLNTRMTPNQIITELESGRQRELRFTIPEGLRKAEIAKLIADSGITSLKSLLNAMNDPALVKEFGVPSKGADGQTSVPGGIEGYLFPDTYQFPKGTAAKTILLRMRKNLDDAVDDRMKKKMAEMGWDLHRTLTLAAIVEKETGQAFERPKISRVFHNRILKKMKMQTDPTVIYGIKNYDGNIRKRDLLTPHPYNTYTIKGLPPGPIASPGKAALEAALFPADGPWVYFVSKNDGTHIFSTTYAEHERNVEIWQRQFFKKKRKK